MAMNDEERLQFAVAQELAAYTQERGPVTEYWDDAQSFIAQLRGRGVTLTPPPAPEPTYTRTFTAREWDVVKASLQNTTGCTAANFLVRHQAGNLLESMRNATPDPEPGA